MASLAKGPRGLPLLGSTLDAIADPYTFFLRTWQTWGDIVELRFGPYRYLLINDADALHHVLVANAANYQKSPTYRVFMPLLGLGLLTSDGAFWKRQRRLIQPAFHHGHLQGFATTMAEATQVFLARLATHPSGQPIDLHAELARLTLRIAGLVLFSVDVDVDGQRVASQIRSALQLIDAQAKSIIRFPEWVPSPANRKMARLRADLDALVFRMIDDPVDRGARDVLSLLRAAVDPETGEKMSREQLRDETMTLVLAGTETTSSALAWTIYLLQQHPAIEAALLAELARFGGRAPTVDELATLDLLPRVLKESMRLYPPAWKFERMAIEDDVVGGVRVPKKTWIGVVTHALHRHPRYWRDPERFDPDRFTEAESATRPKFAYLPFGAGPRTCIGNHFAMMEAQLILALLLPRFAMRLVPDRPVEVATAVTIHPAKGLWMTLAPRGS